MNGLKFVIITGLSTSGHLECEQNLVFVHIYHSELFKWSGLSMVVSVVDLSKSDFWMMLGWVDVLTKRRKEKNYSQLYVTYGWRVLKGGSYFWDVFITGFTLQLLP